MPDKHRLVFNQALPQETPDEKVYDVLEKMREVLRRMSKGAPDIKFIHKVEDTEAQLGGPLGQKINVVYITVVAEFSQTTCLLPDETIRLKQQHDQNQLARDVATSLLEKAKEERRELAKRAREAAKNQPDPVRDFPDLVDTVPAHQVPLDKMLISDAELARASQHPLGVMVSDGPPSKE